MSKGFRFYAYRSYVQDGLYGRYGWCLGVAWGEGGAAVGLLVFAVTAGMMLRG